jgi:hypothetical protein
MSIRKRKKKMDTTQPITNLRSDELRLAVEQMKIYTDNNPNRLTGDHVVTAFKSLIGSSRICGVPLNVPTSCGDVKTRELPFTGILKVVLFTSPQEVGTFNGTPQILELPINDLKAVTT